MAVENATTFISIPKPSSILISVHYPAQNYCLPFSTMCATPSYAVIFLSSAQ